MAQCPKCDQTNQSDARFCNSCGGKLVLSCRNCGTENFLDAQYCKSCGVNLAEAQFGIADEDAQVWWQHFCSYSEFNQMTSTNGWVRNQVYPRAKKLLEDMFPDETLKDEKMALFLAIADRDWCINLAKLDDKGITNGALWAGVYGFAVFDFSSNSVYMIPYEILDGGKHQSDTINITTEQGNNISFTIRVPRPSKGELTGRLVFTIAEVLGNIGNSSIADQEAMSQRQDRERSQVDERFQKADNYISSVRDFFFQIIELRNKIFS